MGQDQELDDLIKSFGGQTLGSTSNSTSSYANIDDLVDSFGGTTLPDSRNLEFSWKDRALKVAEGAAETYGAIADLSHNYITNPIKRLSKNTFGIEENPRDRERSNYRERASQFVNQFADRDLAEQNDSTGKFLNLTGGFLAPIPLPGTGIATAAIKDVGALGKAVAKNTAKETLPAIGAAGALTYTPSFTEEGTFGRSIEDIGKALVGAAAGLKGNKAAARIGKRIENISKNSGKIAATKEALKETLTAPLAKFASKGAEPNKEVLELAKKEGIQLPFNVGANGKWQNWFANNIFNKSVFTSKAYNTVLKNADEGMVKKVVDTIDSISPSELRRGEASLEYKNFLEKEVQNIEEAVIKKYKESYSHATKKDKLVPTNTAQALKSIKKEILKDVDITHADDIILKKVIKKLEKRWKLIPPKDKGLVESLLSKEELESISKLGPAVQAQAIEKLITGRALPKEWKPKKINVVRLSKNRQRINKKFMNDPNLVGVKKYLRKISNAITKDIETSTNLEFLGRWQEANKFFRENVKQRIQTKTAYSILKGEFPRDAFDYMTSPKKIDKLQHIIGNSSKGKEIMQALKKAKVRELFENSFDTAGSLKTATYANTFKKNRNQELLKTLLGKKEYAQLKDIGKIAAEFSKAGKDLLNTSATAPVSKDINVISGVFTGLGALLGSTINPGSSLLQTAAGTLIGAGTYIGAVKAGSYLLSNTKFVNQMHNYALARQAGNELKAQTALKKMQVIANSPIMTKYAAIQGAKELDEK